MALRIVSLLPSASAIVKALGLGSHLREVYPSCHSCEACTTGVGTGSAAKPALLASGTTAFSCIDALGQAVDTPSIILAKSLCDACLYSAQNGNMHVHLFKPDTLVRVFEDIDAMAAVCGVPQRGALLCADLESQLERVRRVSSDACLKAPASPKLLLLERLDPPTNNSSPWVRSLISAAGAAPVTIPHCESLSGRALPLNASWADVRAEDPDVVVVACRGCDLPRTISETLACSELQLLRAWRLGRVYAADGQSYLSQPSHTLSSDAALLARVVWGEVAELPFTPLEGHGWLCVAPLLENPSAIVASRERGGVGSAQIEIEDSAALVQSVARAGASSQGSGMCGVLHEQACAAGLSFYTDPSTGFSVMTRVAHQRRGRCCGNGCRHCPYDHIAVPGKRAAAVKHDDRSD